MRARNILHATISSTTHQLTKAESFCTWRRGACGEVRLWFLRAGRVGTERGACGGAVHGELLHTEKRCLEKGVTWVSVCRKSQNTEKRSAVARVVQVIEYMVGSVKWFHRFIKNKAGVQDPNVGMLEAYVPVGLPLPPSVCLQRSESSCTVWLSEYQPSLAPTFPMRMGNQ